MLWLSATKKISADNKYEGVPALVVEVLSPSTKGKDMAAKLHLYMSGVLEYWIADPAQKNIIQYSFSEDRDIKDMHTLTAGDTISSAVLKSLEIPLKKFSVRLLPDPGKHFEIHHGLNRPSSVSSVFRAGPSIISPSMVKREP